MSVATEFPPEVDVPITARRPDLRVARVARVAGTAQAAPSGSDPRLHVNRSPHQLTGPVAPAAAALGAEVVDLDRWRHHYVGAQAGDRRRNVTGLRIRPGDADQGAGRRADLDRELGAGRTAGDAARRSAQFADPAQTSQPMPHQVVATAPLRLTRRGIVVASAATIAVAAAVVAGAWLSASSASSAAGDVSASSTVVTVQSGDSLWTIAAQVAPQRDPRAVIADLRKLNHLTGDTVTPGQHLRVR